MRDAYRLRKKFEIFVTDFRFDIAYADSSLLEPKPSGVTFHNLITILKQLQNSSFKGFLHDNEFTLSMYNYKKEPKDRRFFHQLNKKFRSYNVHVQLPLKNNFLYSTLDRKVRQLVEGGLFAHWIDRYLSDSSLQKPEPEPDDDKVVLTMDHLSVGFIIWLGMLLIALVAMIAELVRAHLTNYLHGILFQMILRKYQRLQLLI